MTDVEIPKGVAPDPGVHRRVDVAARREAVPRRQLPDLVANSRTWVLLNGPVPGLKVPRPSNSDDGELLEVITRQELGTARLMAALDGYTYAETSLDAQERWNVLHRAADEVKRIRENGLDEGMTSHPVSEYFERWLRGRAEVEAAR